LSANADGSRRHPTRLGIRLGRVRRLAAAALLVLGFGAGVAVDRVAWDGGPGAGASSSLTEHEAFAVFQQTWDLIHDEYVEGEAVDDQALLYGASAGMVEALGDTDHSRFLTPQQAEDFASTIRGEIVGIGVQLEVLDGYPVVVVPIDGSPADLAGIKPGDVIVGIDGESTERLEYEEIRSRLRGEEGTAVSLTVRRPGQAAPLDVTVVRARIKLVPAFWRMLPDGVAQIRLSQFSAGATDAVAEALRAAKAAGATAIILDLRDNPGGLVFETVGVASQLMAEGSVVFQERDRDGAVRTVRTVGAGEGQTLPLVVIVNGNSASAAEILAAALRDNKRAVLIGETTFGTGTVLTTFELADGSAALIGTGLWLTPEGEQIWKIGVDPDVEVELPPAVYPSRPQEDAEVTPAELSALEDVQLQLAHDLAVSAASSG
jgi:carboxyl-terminal processing protease